MQKPPFPKVHQLNGELDAVLLTVPITKQVSPVSLPGQPRIHIANRSQVQEYLENEFLLKDLEIISPYLWMMSKQDSKNISPLHRQKVKGREIIITEDPRLHLV